MLVCLTNVQELLRRPISLLTNLTHTLTVWIYNLYAFTGLAGIILAMAIESCCIPLPSEVVMPVAGFIIGSYYTSNPLHLPGTNPSFPLWLNLVLVALAGATGCLIGSIAAYYIGYKGGRPLMLKYGRYVLISQHDADRADQFFQRWGSATAFFSRLLPVVRTYISLPAGISKMPFVKFCVFTFLGSFPWCLLLAYMGYVLGGNLSRLSPIFHSLDVVILVVVVLLVALYIWRHIRNDRRARAAHAAVEAAIVAQPSPVQTWNQSQQVQSPRGQVPQSQQQGLTQQPFPPQQARGQISAPSGIQPPQSPWGQVPQPQQNGSQSPQPPQGWVP